MGAEDSRVVIVADDQPSARQLISTLLGYRGYRVLEAADGVEALALVEAQQPDLVISDLLMPRMDGFELARRIRTSATTCHVPIIFYTASYHVEKAAKLASECGISSFIVKPAEPEAVFAAVDHALLRHDSSPSRPIHPDPVSQAQYALVRDAAAEQASRLEAARQRLVDVAAIGQSLAHVENIVEAAKILCARAREILLVRESFAVILGSDGETVEACIHCGGDGNVRVRPGHLFVPAGVARAEGTPTGVLPAAAAAALCEVVGMPAGRTFAASIATIDERYGWLGVGDPVGDLDDFDGATLAALAAHLAAYAEHAADIRRRTAELSAESAAHARTEAELRSTDEHFRELFDGVLDGMIQSTANGTILRANPALLRMLGYGSIGDLRTIHAQDLYRDPATRARLFAEFEGVGVIRNVEVELRRKDGAIVHALLSGRVVRRPDGSVDCYEGSVRDVTERKRAEVARHKAEEQRQVALKAARCGVWQFDPVTGAVEWGETMSDVFGVPPSGFPSTIPEFLRFVHPDDRQRVAAALSAISPSEELASIEFRTEWPDGSTHWLGNAGRFSHVGLDGAPVFIGVAIDITEQRRLQDQFRQAQKMEAVGQLAGGVAHDFNNLITAIIGFAELIDASLQPDDQVRSDLEEIVRAGKRAAGLTRQLLAFSRRQLLQPTVLDVNELVTNLMPMVSRLMGEDVRLETHLEPHVHRVMADAGQFEQVIMNLAVNARDAMPKGGTLSVTTRTVDLNEAFSRRNPGSRTGLHVAIAIRDTGVGMSAATQERIFEPFFTTKDKDRGTGLGLSTVYGIVKQSGGYVQVSSALGRGTTFIVYLPAFARAVEGVRKEPGPAAIQSAGTETLLVAEDEDSVRSLMKTLLERSGYRVLLARDVPSALALARSASSIQLLVTDVVLPGGTGPELFERLAQERPSLKVLYTSGYPGESLGKRGILDPAISFLSKPFSAHDLSDHVRRTLDHPPLGAPVEVPPQPVVTH